MAIQSVRSHHPRIARLKDDTRLEHAPHADRLLIDESRVGIRVLNPPEHCMERRRIGRGPELRNVLLSGVEGDVLRVSNG